MTRKKIRKRCKDCDKDAPYRPAKHPGPRCSTHHRAVVAERNDRKFDQYLRRTYNITAEQYWAIYEAQGGVCALCRIAKGKSRRLAVDHDHKCCPTTPTCGRCVRSLCCTTCNKMLGHIRDDPEMAERVLLYLVDPPGRRIIAEWNV